MAFGGAAANLGSAFGQIFISTGDSEAKIASLDGALGTLDKHTAISSHNTQIAGLAFAGFGAAVGGFFGAALNDAANFEQRMSAVQAVTGATGKTFEDLNNLALQIGKDTQYSATQAASAIEELGKAGVSTQNILAGAAAATTSLAAAAGVDLPTAATLMANAMNEFSIDGSKSAEVADLFAAAAASSAADAVGLGDSLDYVGATAHALGMSLPDVIALLAALADQGLQGSAAGTALNQMILSLVNPTSTATDELNALGISVFDSAGNFKGATQFVKDFAEATKGMTQEQRIAAEGIIFTTHGMNALNLLLNDTTDSAIKSGKGLDQYQENVTKAGAAADQAKARMDNFRGSLEQLRGSVETLMIRVGDTFLAGARKLVDGATLIVNALLGLPQPVIIAASALLGLAGAASALLGAYILLEPKIKAFVGAMETIGPIIAAATPELLALAAAAAILGFAFHSNFGGIRTDVDNVVGSITGGLSRAKSVIGDVGATIKHFLQPDRTVEGLAHDINRVTDAMMSLGFSRTSANLISFALYDIRVPLVKLQNDFNAVNKVAGGFLDIIGGGASAKAVDAFKKYSDVLFGPKVGAQFAAATITLRQALHGLGQSILETTGIDLSKLFNFKDLLVTLIGVVGDVATFIDQRLLPAIGTGLTHAINGAVDVVQFLNRNIVAISGAVTTLAGDFTNVLGDALSFIADLAGGNISGALTDLGKTVTDVFATGVDAGTIIIHLAGWAFDVGEDVLTALLNKIYTGLSGKGGGNSNAFGTVLPGEAGGQTAAPPIPIGAVTLLIGGWLIDAGEAAAGDLLGTIKTKVYDLLGISGGAASGAGALNPGGGADLGTSGGVPIPAVSLSVTGFIVNVAEDAAGTLLGKIKDKVLSLLGIGGTTGPSEATQFGASNAGNLSGVGGVGDVPIGTQGVSITGWQVNDITTGIETLAGRVGSAIHTAWDAIKDVVVPLGEKAVSIGFKVGEVAVNLAFDVAAKIDDAWPSIRDDAKALGEKAIALGFKIGKVAENLLADVNTAIDGAWPAIRDDAKDVSGKIVHAGQWVVKEATDGELLTDVGDLVTTALSKMDIQITDYTIHVGTPGAKGITIDVGAIFGSIWDLLTAPITVSAGTGEKADAAGRNIADALTGFIGAQLKKFFTGGFDTKKSGGGGGGGGAAGEGLDQVVGKFVGGFVFQVFDNSVGAIATNIQDRLAKWTAGPNAAADGINAWLDSLPGKVFDKVKAGGSGIVGLLRTVKSATEGVGTWELGMGGLIVDKVLSLFGDGASIGKNVVDKLSGIAGDIAAAVTGWIHDLPGKIKDLIGGGGPSNNASVVGTGSLVGAALANGAGNDPGSVITDLIKAMLTPDLSKIGFPKLPDWTTDPATLIPGLSGFISSLTSAKNTIVGIWNDIFHAGDNKTPKPPLTPFGPPGFSAPNTPPKTPTVEPAPAPTAGSNNANVNIPVTGTPTAAPAKGTPTTGSQKIVLSFLSGLGLSDLSYDPATGGTGTAAELAVSIPISFDTSGKPSNTARQGSKNSAGAIADVLAGLGLVDVVAGAGGITASTPPVTVTVPVTFAENATSDLSRNKSPEAPTTAIFKADDTDVVTKFAESEQLGILWGTAAFTGLFLGDNSGAGKQYAGALGYGVAWDGSHYTGFYDGDNSGAGDQYSGAVSYGDAWDGTVFTASFDIDTTGIANAVTIIDAAVAHIASVLPHSPAEKGPLSKPISFKYIADNMATTAARIKGLATDSAATLANAFGQTPNAMAQLGSSNVAPASSSAGVTVIQYSLKADEYATLLQQAQQGADANSWIRDYNG